jgi:hypothetical protein
MFDAMIPATEGRYWMEELLTIAFDLMPFHFAKDLSFRYFDADSAIHPAPILINSSGLLV